MVWNFMIQQVFDFYSNAFEGIKKILPVTVAPELQPKDL
jgi:hypothetical protein